MYGAEELAGILERLLSIFILIILVFVARRGRVDLTIPQLDRVELRLLQHLVSLLSERFTEREQLFAHCEQVVGQTNKAGTTRSLAVFVTMGRVSKAERARTRTRLDVRIVGRASEGCIRQEKVGADVKCFVLRFEKLGAGLLELGDVVGDGRAGAFERVRARRCG